jgi:hypothetical protein
MQKQQLFKSTFSIAILICLLLTANNLFATTDIGNGKLFVCSVSTIISAKKLTTVTPSRAKAKFKTIIAQQNLIISNTSNSSAKISKAIAARKNAKAGLKDIKLCENSELDGTIRGDWNLTFENGLTPVQNGFNSMTISFAATNFVQDFDGSSIDCHWEGTYRNSSNPERVVIKTTIGTGGTICNQAVGQERNAIVSLSEDKNTLTLDYRPEGTLQVYERVS